MIKLNLRRMALVFILAIFSSILSAQQTWKTTIYLDYTYFLSDRGAKTIPFYVMVTQHHDITKVRPLAYGTALVLILLILGMNMAAIITRYRLRRKRRG